MAFNKLTLIKLVELVLAIIIFCLHYNTYEANSISHLYLITTTFSGFLIVFVGTFISLVTGHGLHKTIDMFYCLVGAILYIVAGSLCINHFQGWTFSSSTTNMGLTKGSLAIVQGVICLVDGFFTFRAE